MSRLVKIKAGSAVVPGTQPIEGDLAESWTQPNETTYVFTLRKGVRWHPKPPVNGRELTAEDVKYTYERFLTMPGNGNRGTLEQIDRIETLDNYRVRFTLKEPFVWFLDALASTSTWIVAKEAVEMFGDLKKWESVIGTGPWMLERHEPGVRMTFVRNPNYFVPALPYADGVEVSLDPDPASGFASFLVGNYDFGPEYGMVVRRSDLDVAKARKPNLQTRDYTVVFGGYTAMKLEQEPFKDLRVRQALSRASNWREVLETNAWSQGKGVPNPAIPAAFTEWSIPIDQLPGEGRKLYDHDNASAKRLLAQAGFPAGFKTTVETTTGYGPDYMDAVQVTLKSWKAAGIDAELKAQGVRRLHRDDDLRQARQDDRRATGGLDRSRQLSLPDPHAGPTPQRRPRQRREGHRDDQASAEDGRRRQAPRRPLRSAALPVHAGVLRVRALRELRRRLGTVREELRPEHRP
jgi:peptide/nickel transport system substrate-binding protein